MSETIIKFQAWHDNKMWDVEYINFERSVIGLLRGQQEALEEREALLSQVKLIRFIGLTDKKERKIYEGHLLKYEVWTRGGDLICSHQPAEVVVYHNPLRAWLRWHGKANAYFFHNPMDRPKFDEFECKDRFEIIGNIYEHPGLLAEILEEDK